MKQWIIPAVALAALTACQSAYYGTMEKFGVEKRDILVDRVDDARDSQTEAQQEFRSAFERLDEMLNIEGGELEETYNALNDDYKDSKAAAEDVRERIDAVDDVAQDLFDEWSEELGEYSNDNMRRQSERQLRETERRYAELLRVMERAADKMQPVLDKMQDNVLYLKHNLNAKAIDAIRGEFNSLQNDISSLIADMEASIEESNRFIESMQ
jgi:Skp family chaperone for outer membrane proteins